MYHTVQKHRLLAAKDSPVPVKFMGDHKWPYKRITSKRVARSALELSPEMRKLVDAAEGKEVSFQAIGRRDRLELNAKRKMFKLKPRKRFSLQCQYITDTYNALVEVPQRESNVLCDYFVTKRTRKAQKILDEGKLRLKQGGGNGKAKLVRARMLQMVDDTDELPVTYGQLIRLARRSHAFWPFIHQALEGMNIGVRLPVSNAPMPKPELKAGGQKIQIKEAYRDSIVREIVRKGRDERRLYLPSFGEFKQPQRPLPKKGFILRDEEGKVAHSATRKELIEKRKQWEEKEAKEIEAFNKRIRKYNKDLKKISSEADRVDRLRKAGKGNKRLYGSLDKLIGRTYITWTAPEGQHLSHLDKKAIAEGEAIEYMQAVADWERPKNGHRHEIWAGVGRESVKVEKIEIVKQADGKMFQVKREEVIQRPKTWIKNLNTGMYQYKRSHAVAWWIKRLGIIRGWDYRRISKWTPRKKLEANTVVKLQANRTKRLPGRPSKEIVNRYFYTRADRKRRDQKRLKFRVDNAILRLKLLGFKTKKQQAIAIKAIGLDKILAD